MSLSRRASRGVVIERVPHTNSGLEGLFVAAFGRTLTPAMAASRELQVFSVRPREPRGSVLTVSVNS